MIGNLQFINIFTNFFRTVDLLPRSFDCCRIKIPTCLTLPFTDIIVHSLSESHPAFITFITPQQLPQNYPGAKQLATSDIFHYDHDLQIIRLRNPSTDIVRFQNISRFVINLVRIRQLFLQPFFFAQNVLFPNMPPLPSLPPNLDISPFSFRLRLGSITTIKYFKKLIHYTASLSLMLASSKWYQFWQFEIPPSARIIRYRALHNKLPTKSILHCLIPITHSSPSCLFCPSIVPTDETSDHFLFRCPSKLTIWSQAFTSYISPTANSQFIASFLSEILSLSLPENFSRDSSLSLLHPELFTYQIIACTIQSIWLTHWRFIFDNIPIIPHLILNSVSK